METSIILLMFSVKIAFHLFGATMTRHIFHPIHGCKRSKSLVKYKYNIYYNITTKINKLHEQKYAG